LALGPWFASPEELEFVLLPGGMPTVSSSNARTSFISRCAEDEEAEGTAEDGEEEDAEPSLAMPNDWRELKKIRRKFRGAYQFPTYSDFTFKRKLQPQKRIRLARWGKKSMPFYRIIAAFQKPKAPRSARYSELVGFWDPMCTLDDPRAFEIKCDRVVYWLRLGAQPTDMAANLFDRVGLIRRTGPQSRLGEWEWRIPRTSGPEAPEGWEWNGVQKVTWGNRPMPKTRKCKPKYEQKSRRKNRPLIEMYGFRGYARIPMDHEVITEPVTKSSLVSNFKNTKLPIY